MRAGVCLNYYTSELLTCLAQSQVSSINNKHNESIKYMKTLFYTTNLMGRLYNIDVQQMLIVVLKTLFF